MEQRTLSGRYSQGERARSSTARRPVRQHSPTGGENVPQGQ
ncbi:unnamed protein product, partial [Leptosia nina]